MRKSKIYNALVLLTLCVGGAAAACGQPSVSACPQVLIDQKYDHVTCLNYRAQGWDTAVTCHQRELLLTTEPYLPVTYFHGTYTVDEIEYNPADPTFSGGTRMPVGTDDDFAPQATAIPFTFFFFGIAKNYFRLGANGMITFATDQFVGGNGCPWSFSAALPWPNGKVGAPSMPEGTTGSVPLARMRDAIYGIYEDTHPLGSYLSGNQGIYYGIQGDWPCRKIICSWNGIPTYKGSQNLNNRCTYQIVCYEGSNIVEVHVRHRGVNPNWQNAAGIIGLQNATGLPQVPSDDHSAPNFEVDSGSQPAFWPEGKNLFATPLDSVAYRFTPQGRTVSNCVWYRIGDDGDSIRLGADADDPEGYMIPMDTTSDHPTRVGARVRPTRPTRYVAKLYFMTAEGTVYNLTDDIVVGVDTSSRFTLRGYRGSGMPDADTGRVMQVCRSSGARVRVEYAEPLAAAEIRWTASLLTPNDTVGPVPLADSLYTLEDSSHTFRLAPSNVPPVSVGGAPGQARVDTIVLRAQVDFSNGCSAFDTFMLCLVPSYDMTESYDICEGDTLLWHVDGQRYWRSTAAPSVTTPTGAGCDSTVRLALTVHPISHTTVSLADCHPVSWIDGRTYDHTNSDTRDVDTVVVSDRYGCDSVLHLAFSFLPVEARIGCDVDYLDYDHTGATLTDLSSGHDRCLWRLPDGRYRTDATLNYTVDPHLDSACFTLVAFSPYGCTDTARLTIPFRRITLWLPNIFTPDRLDDNRLFAPVGKGIVRQEMYVYDRLGRMVYYGSGTSCAWDGRDRNGRLCEQGAYAYVLRYADITDPRMTKTLTGSVTLLR